MVKGGFWVKGSKDEISNFIQAITVFNGTTSQVELYEPDEDGYHWVEVTSTSEANLNGAKNLASNIANRSGCSTYFPE